jgi:hypothetical protein
VALKYLFISFFLALIVFSCSEISKDFNGENSLNSSINENDSVGFDFSTDLADDIAAYKTVVHIIRETGLAQNFIVLPGNVNNVKAYIDNNERIIEYNPGFMKKLQGDTNWPGLSVLARQIGHHLSNHELENGIPNIQEEIEADKYAGFVLYKMGASLDEALRALQIVISEDSSGSNISNNSRLASLTKGWKNAKTLMSDTIASNKYDLIVASIDSSIREVSFSDTSYSDEKVNNTPEYLYKVFLALDKSIYFVDKENIIFQEIEGRYVNIGFKRDSDKPGFDWVFVKGGDSYGVDLKGRLWAFSTDNNFYIVGQALRL